MYDTLQIGSGVDTLETPKERLIALRNFIAFLEDPERRFNMSVWAEDQHGCGTAHCIGGWAEILFFGESGKHGTMEVGAKLGLTRWRAHDLFFPRIGMPWEAISTADAVKVLTHLIDTGEVDWGVAGYEVDCQYHPANP